MRVLPVQRVDGSVRADIEIAGAVHRVTYRCDAIDGSCAADALFAATLVPAMAAAATLHIEEPVSPRLLGAAATIQDIFRTWEQRYPLYQRYRRIEVDAIERSSGPVSGLAGRRASFFSGGVDSFYTVLRQAPAPDALIFVQGFDVPLSDTATTSLVTERMRAAATDLGKPLVVVATDLREFSDRYARWNQYHGAAMASVGHLLAPQVTEVVVSATHTYAHLSPLGSHPLLDPLWSSEQLRIAHYGLEASRLDKLAYLASHPVARRHLHVCHRNEPGAFNCGRCEKCLRTMTGLEALGVLTEFPTLPDVIDEDLLRRIDIPPESYSWQAALALLDAREGPASLRRLLRRRLYSRPQLAVREARRLAGRAANTVRDRRRRPPA